MKVLKAQRELAIPEGVDVTLKARKIVVKGPRGTLQRDFTHLPRIDLHHDKENSQIIATMFFSSKKRLACLRTVCSHMSNLFDGDQGVQVQDSRRVRALPREHQHPREGREG